MISSGLCRTKAYKMANREFWAQNALNCLGYNLLLNWDWFPLNLHSLFTPISLIIVLRYFRNCIKDRRTRGIKSVCVSGSFFSWDLKWVNIYIPSRICILKIGRETLKVQNFRWRGECVLACRKACKQNVWQWTLWEEEHIVISSAREALHCNWINLLSAKPS